MSLNDQIVALFESVGRLVCHQMPERTLLVGGHYLPVCARDTGAYLGFYIGYLILPLRNRKATGPPKLWITLLMIMPILLDGATQWLGLRTSTNDIRLLTGLLFGASITPFLVYLLSATLIARKLPLIRIIRPIRVELDNLDCPWLGYSAYAIGLAAVAILFFTIKGFAGSTSSLFYWLTSSMITISVIAHVFILPILVLSSVIIERHVLFVSEP